MGYQPQNPTLPITTQADSQIDTWLQDILLPGTNSPTTLSPAFSFSSPSTLDIQESFSEQGISDMEFNSMDLSWSLPTEVNDQFLDLLEAPFKSLASGPLESASIAEPIIL